MAFRDLPACLLLLVVVSGCIKMSGEVPTIISTEKVNQESWYNVYFSDPGGRTSESKRGGPDAALAEAIRQAQLSVDVAMDTLDLWSLRDALRDAHRRGVTVRVVVESENLDEPEIQQLIEAGIPVLGDRREGLMHNKFAILDRQEVWSGSMNFTVSGAYKANNNLIRIRSSRLAEDYLVEFEEMFVEDQFGPGSPANTPYPALSIAGTQVEVYFSPDDGIANRLIELIEGAQNGIDILAFSFTSDELAAAILERAKAGVNVTGVFDETQAQQNEGAEFARFLENGLDVHLDGNPGSMHHKVLIIDEQIVVTGSYNFSNNAETRNDENTLVIYNPEIAALYLQEFHEVYAQAQK